MKFFKNYIFKILAVIIPLVLICAILSTIHLNNNERLVHVQSLVSEKVNTELGEDYSILMIKYDHKNQMYSIGYVNSDNTHAVIYIARPNVTGKTWIINQLASQTGSNASSLFSDRRNVQLH